MLRDGVIAPVLLLIDNAGAAVNVPPVNVPVPVKLTGCVVVSEAQNEPV